MGLTNYAAAYATGLLLARRHLQKLKMDSAYKGKENADGEYFDVEGENPFTCVLDVGLARTTTGAKVFAVMKGFADGGVHIPHRFYSFLDNLLYSNEMKIKRDPILRL